MKIVTDEFLKLRKDHSCVCFKEKMKCTGLLWECIALG